MPLTSYATLQTAIADWLNRTDLSAQIPDFIALVEAEIKRRLRRTKTISTLSVTGETVTLPTDLAELQSISLVSGSASQDVPLRIGTMEMIVERKARSAGVAGRPTDAAVIAGSGKIIFAPPPDQTYTANIIYYATLTPLSNSNTSNAVLVEAPDAYLYGALLQAEPYLEHDERLPMWQTKFDNAINQLNDVRDREEHNASLQPMRLPMTFG
jgi:hypothetical protein